MEYALLRSGYVTGFPRPSRPSARAKPDWDRFAKHTLATNPVPPDKIRATAPTLLSAPPQLLHVIADGNLEWTFRFDSPTAEWTRVLRAVRDVRNNLFHGGKFRTGPVDAPERNAPLLHEALAILALASAHDADVRRFYEET